MPRSLTLGNGEMLVCYDKFGQVKDLYFPYIGLENHIGENCVHKIGVYVDGQFSWIDSPGWEISIDYHKFSLSSNISAKNQMLGISLVFDDVVHNDRNIYLRNVILKNDTREKKSIKLFFNQQLYIYGTERGDTSYFEPERNIIIHYEGRRIFVISGICQGKKFDEYSVGIFGEDGKEGTWKDAEDGKLENNPIEHGSVDSVIGFSSEIEPGKVAKVSYWITAAKTFAEAVDLNDYVVRKTPEKLLNSARSFWQAWAGKSSLDFSGLDLKIEELFKKSLLVIRSHVGENGSIIASGDSDMPRGGRDTYAYVWPRDAAFIAMALDKAGYSDIARKYFDFASDVIYKKGFFFHKYRPDKSMGSSWHAWIKDGQHRLAIQEDETALALFALWEHYLKSRDIEFIESVYDNLIRRAADFMCGYVDGLTGLPLGSYDIWEEKFGIATFTAASVYGGLIAAYNFAELLGKDEEAKKYHLAAKTIRNATQKNLYNKESRFFYRNIRSSEGKIFKDPTLDISSFFGIFRFGVMDADDPKMEKAYKTIKEKFYIDSPVGGVMRYKGDRYFQVDEAKTENPWFITTLWMAQFDIKKSKKLNDLRQAEKWINWAVSHASSSGILSEQHNRNTGEALSVAPLIWSHAEFVITVVDYIKKRKELKKGRK